MLLNTRVVTVHRLADWLYTVIPAHHKMSHAQPP